MVPYYKCNFHGSHFLYRLGVIVGICLTFSLDFFFYTISCMYDLFFFRRLFFSIIRLNFFPAVWHYRKYRYSFSFIWWAIRFASYIKWKWHKKLTKPILKPFNDSYSPIITRYKQNVNYHMLIIYLDSVSLQVANSVFFFVLFTFWWKWIHCLAQTFYFNYC